jgi:hypothetical protein
MWAKDKNCLMLRQAVHIVNTEFHRVNLGVQTPCKVISHNIKIGEIKQ